MQTRRNRLFKHTALSIIAIGLMSIAGGAAASQAQTGTGATADIAFGQSFAALDSDGNGQISRAEAEANGVSPTAFQSAESSRDNALSPSEFQAARAARDGVVGEAVEIGEDTPAEMEMAADDTMDMTTGDMTETTGDITETTGDMSETTGGMAETTGDMNETTGNPIETTPDDVMNADDAMDHEPAGAAENVTTDDR